MANNSIIKNTCEEDNNSICSDDESLNMCNNSIQDILSNIQKIQKTPNKKLKKKEKKTQEIVIEEDEDDIDVSESDDSEDDDEDSDDNDKEDGDEDEDGEDDSGEEDDSDDSDEEDDDMYDSLGVTNEGLAGMFQGVFLDSEGNSIADSLSKIADELHKLNHNMKKNYSKK